MEWWVYPIAYFVIGFIIATIDARLTKGWYYDIEDFLGPLFLWPFLILIVIITLLLNIYIDFIRKP